LNTLSADVSGKENKAGFTADTAKACMAVLKITNDQAPLQYILTVLCDMVREDSSCYGMFEEAMKNGVAMFAPLTGVLKMKGVESCVADKAAWLLSALMSHSPQLFKEQDATDFVAMLSAEKCCSELGLLESVTNLLKAEAFRAATWSQPSVPSMVFKVDPKNTAAPAPIMYKRVFAIWMVSFDPKLMQSLQGNKVVQKIKSILAQSRTEKVVRLSLTVLKNFVTQKTDCAAICEDIVEEGLLDVVQQLEYEKWRDAELYDDIKELVQLISNEVKELSNFDRYMKELESGDLSWGFIHSSKFFGENVMKFETNDFKAVKLLAGLLSSTNATTLAVACHDIGEFVALHPFGKKQVSRLGVKERVMELMGSTDQDKKDVRREALLCCQKIMLNKWQDVAAEKK